jgi:hypothetical protein
MSLSVYGSKAKGWPGERRVAALYRPAPFRSQAIDDTSTSSTILLSTGMRRGFAKPVRAAKPFYAVALSMTPRTGAINDLLNASPASTHPLSNNSSLGPNWFFSLLLAL